MGGSSRDSTLSPESWGSPNLEHEREGTATPPPAPPPDLTSNLSLSTAAGEQFHSTSLQFVDSPPSSNNDPLTPPLMVERGGVGGKHWDWQASAQSSVMWSDEQGGSLDLREDYYRPEAGVGEMEIQIEQLKQQLRRAEGWRVRGEGWGVREEEESLTGGGGGGGAEELQQDLRERIVQLQLQLQKLKEEESSEPYQSISGHRFVRQPRQTNAFGGVVCEGCGGKVRGLFRPWFRCRICSRACHERCMESVSRKCFADKEEVGYELRVCPEKGLLAQQFRCACCNKNFIGEQMTRDSPEVRQCDYTGLYYCSDCHYNESTVIPARVVHNWDFRFRKVCCECSVLLEKLFSRPLLRIQHVNPLLYTYAQDLVTIETLRQNFLHMKHYFVQCSAAKESHLLQKLDKWPHFKESVHLFSMKDLVQAHEGVLLPQLQEIHKVFVEHIKTKCQTCSGQGYFCELCGSSELLYPFDRHVNLCPSCSTVFHKVCFTEMASCPRCSRARNVTGHS